MKPTKLAAPFAKEFKPLTCPPYQPAKVGDWTLFRAPDHHGDVAAYFTLNAPMPQEYWVLTKNAQVSMSLTPSELQSQGYHARLASGNVMVMGLGMGALVFNLLRNPRVNHITVCEYEADVVSLLKCGASWFDEAIKSGKVDVSIADAFHYVPQGPHPDTLLVDIWRGVGSPQSEADVMRIQSNICAGTVAWWGQELALVSWIYSNYDQSHRFPFRRDHAAAYEKHLGFSLLGANHQNYPSMVRAAATNVSIIMKSQELDQRRGSVIDRAIGSGSTDMASLEHQR